MGSNKVGGSNILWNPCCYFAAESDSYRKKRHSRRGAMVAYWTSVPKVAGSSPVGDCFFLFFYVIFFFFFFSCCFSCVFCSLPPGLTSSVFSLFIHFPYKFIFFLLVVPPCDAHLICPETLGGGRLRGINLFSSSELQQTSPCCKRGRGRGGGGWGGRGRGRGREKENKNEVVKGMRRRKEENKEEEKEEEEEEKEEEEEEGVPIIAPLSIQYLSSVAHNLPCSLCKSIVFIIS